MIRSKLLRKILLTFLCLDAKSTSTWSRRLFTSVSGSANVRLITALLRFFPPGKNGFVITRVGSGENLSLNRRTLSVTLEDISYRGFRLWLMQRSSNLSIEATPAHMTVSAAPQ